MQILGQHDVLVSPREADATIEGMMDLLAEMGWKSPRPAKFSVHLAGGTYSLNGVTVTGEEYQAFCTAAETLAEELEAEFEAMTADDHSPIHHHALDYYYFRVGLARQLRDFLTKEERIVILP
jgi:hypothetical protein